MKEDDYPVEVRGAGFQAIPVRRRAPDELALQQRHLASRSPGPGWWRFQDLAGTTGRIWRLAQEEVQRQARKWT